MHFDVPLSPSANRGQYFVYLRVGRADFSYYELSHHNNNWAINNSAVHDRRTLFVWSHQAVAGCGSFRTAMRSLPHPRPHSSGPPPPFFLRAGGGGVWGSCSTPLIYYTYNSFIILNSNYSIEIQFKNRFCG
jgi:hypothetical protein